MRIHLINLDRDAERLRKFREINAHITDIVRPIAILGRDLDKEALIRDRWIEPELGYSDPALGSATSHIALWRTAVTDQTPVTIVEDDAILSHHIAASADAMVQRLPADWHVILWGWNFDAFLWVEMVPGVSAAKMEFQQDRMRQNVNAFQRLASTSAPVRLRHGFGVMCYTVSPTGAQALLNICLPLRNMYITFEGFGVTIKNKTIDAAMNAAYPSLNAYVAIPPLAISENRHEFSTIHGKT